jgi:hypothetical protein
MTLNEKEDFLLKISKEENTSKVFSNAIQYVFMKQALFFNIFLITILVTLIIFTETSAYGGVIGLSIVSSMLIYRINYLKNDYIEDTKKIFKQEKIGLLLNYSNDPFDMLFNDVGLKFILKNLINKEINLNMKFKVNYFLTENVEKLSYVEINNYVKTMENQKVKVDYNKIKKYSENFRGDLLGKNFKDF